MIEVQGLTRRFGGRLALDGLTLSVPTGQVLGFLGPAGAGKSTALRILAGCLLPSEGTASVAGFDVVERSREARRRTGYLVEGAPMYDDMRVGSYLDTMCRLRGVAPRARRARIEEVLESCGLAGRRRELIGRLPSDLRRRAGLAQAVVHDPQVLLLDEPAAGLDPARAGEVHDLAARLGRGRTVIVAGRVVADLSASCERLVILRAGRVVADETPGSLDRRLGQRRRREVLALVQGDVTAAVQRSLRRLAGVADLRLADAGDGGRRVTVTGAGEDLQDAVARVILQRGLKLKELSTREATLDDVFEGLTLDEAS